MFAKRLIVFFLSLSFLLLIGCSKGRQKQMDPGFRVHFNKMSVFWKGMIRLKGGIPVLENTKIKYHEVHTHEEDSVFVFEFLHNFEDHVEIKAVVSPVHQTILFFLSPNHFHTRKATDFVGMLFDEIPGIESGKAWVEGTFREFSNMDELKKFDTEFLLVRYSDGNYMACMPLSGKGYKAKLQEYNHSYGLKAWHLQDGHDEYDIPLAAVSFGSDPAELYKSLMAEPAISDNIPLKNLSL